MVDGAHITAADLVGTWRLLDWEAVDEAGDVRRPFGDAPIGYVVYTADGHMITTISRPDRTHIGADLQAASDETIGLAARSFLAYSGGFRVDGDQVVHTVEMSLLPDWVGGEQRRYVELSRDGSALTLSTDPMPTYGGSARHRLGWQRVTPTSASGAVATHD